jgi:hypothetical protein
MRDAWMPAGAAIGAILALAPVDRALAAGGAPFDGVWTVAVDCASVANVEGYNWRFPAEVSSGFMSRLYRPETTTAIGHITGHIRPDGALLRWSAEPDPNNVVLATHGRARRSITRLTPISTDRAAPASETSSAHAG